MQFFENVAPGLRELHLLDIFARQGFMAEVGKMLAEAKALKILEVSYTYRHADEDFLSRVPGEELMELLTPSLVGASFSIASSQATGQEGDDPGNMDEEGNEVPPKEGVMVLNPTHADPLLNALIETEGNVPTELKMLDTSLYTLNATQLQQVVEKHKGLMVLTATLGIEPDKACKDALLGALKSLKEAEIVEIVGSPSLGFYMAVRNPIPISLTNARTDHEHFR